MISPTNTKEMLEMYTDVTELLRHFYAILRRTGSQAVSCNAAAAAKAEGIVQRLAEDKGGRLEAKKRRIVAEAADRSGSRTDGPVLYRMTYYWHV